MNIYCPICGEAWVLGCLHDEAEDRYGIPYFNVKSNYTLSRPNPSWVSEEYQTVFKNVVGEFQTTGCAVFGDPCEEPLDQFSRTRAMLAGEAYTTFGDDMDGAAAILADWMSL